MKRRAASPLERARRIFHVARRRRWIVLAVAWACFGLGVLALAFYPERYEASARVFVDTQTVLKPLMVGLTFQPDVDQQVRMLARTLISRPNVEQLIDQSPDLGFDLRDEAARAAVVSRLTRQIRIAAGDRGNLYTITFRDVDADRALRVVTGMVSLFVTSGSDGKKRDSEEAGRFIDEQVQATEQKLQEAEGRLKDFKVRHFGLTGVSNQDYFARISALSDQAAQLQSELDAALRARDAYRKEIAEEDPNLPELTVPGAPRTPVAELADRAQEQRKRLDDLLAHYTPSHPDVANTRSMLDDLERRLARERAKQAREAASGRSSAATSPVYQKLRLSLAESEANVAALQSKLGAVQRRLAETRESAGRVPQVEAELAQLARDYEVMRKGYEQLVSRRESATLAVKLDESSQMASFRVIEPPHVADRPVVPSRLDLALLLAGVVAVGGVLAALVVEAVRPTVNDLLALERLTGRPVLGGIRREPSESAQAAAWRGDRWPAILASALVFLYLGWLGWVAMAASAAS